MREISGVFQLPTIASIEITNLIRPWGHFSNMISQMVLFASLSRLAPPSPQPPIRIGWFRRCSSYFACLASKEIIRVGNSCPLWNIHQTTWPFVGKPTSNPGLAWKNKRTFAPGSWDDNELPRRSQNEQSRYYGRLDCGTDGKSGFRVPGKVIPEYVK